jgi:hypothetical protein
MKHLTLALIAGVFGASGAAAQDNTPDPARKVRDQLASMRITLDFTDTRLSDVISYFREFSGLNFHLDSDAAAREGDKVTLKLKDVTLKSALKLLLNPRDLVCTYRTGVLRIAPKSKLADSAVTRVYDARELLFRLKDFAGPRVELVAPGKDALVGVLFDPYEEPVQAINEDNVCEIIRTCTGSRTWDENPAASISQINGLLVITHSRAVQQEIERVLERLKALK